MQNNLILICQKINTLLTLIILGKNKKNNINCQFRNEKIKLNFP